MSNSRNEFRFTTKFKKQLETICDIKPTTTIDFSTYQLSNLFEDEILKIQSLIQSLFQQKQAYVYTQASLFKELKNNGNNITQRTLQQALKIMESRKQVIRNYHNMKGVLQSKEVFGIDYWFFQPVAISNNDIPIIYRYLPFLNYNFEFFNLNEFVETAKETTNIKSKKTSLLEILTNYKFSTVYNEFNKKKGKTFIINRETIQTEFLLFDFLQPKSNLKPIFKKLLKQNKKQNLIQSLLLKYFSYYYLDRLPLSIKKRLLEFVIGYFYFDIQTTIEKNDTIIQEFGLDNMFDYFSQKIGYPNLQREMKPLYLFQYKENYYYRLLEINKIKNKYSIKNQYYKAVFKNNSLQFEKELDIPLEMDITYQDYFQKNQFDYTFLQFFGKLEKQSKTNIWYRNRYGSKCFFKNK